MIKKITANMMALIIMLTTIIPMIPATSYANVKSDAEAYKQICIEYINESFVMNGTSPTTDFYNKEVLTAIQKRYDRINVILDDDLAGISFSRFYIEFHGELEKLINEITFLSGLTKDTYNKKITELKKTLNDKYRMVVKNINKDDYNDWYWDRYKSLRKDVKKKISRIKDVETYITAAHAPFFMIMPDYEEDGFIIEYETVGSSLSYYWPKNDFIYSKEDMKDEIDMIVEIFETLTDSWKSGRISKGLMKRMKGFKKKAEKKEDINDIYALFNSIIKSYLKETSEELLNDNDRLRWLNRFRKYIYSIGLNNYTNDDAYAIIEEYSLFEEYIIDGDVTPYMTESLAKAYYDRSVKKISKLKTEARLVKIYRKKYGKDLKKKYINNKAYIQKKAKPLYKKAVKAMKGESSFKYLKEKYRAYRKKLNKTIKKFNVKIEKTGKGKVYLLNASQTNSIKKASYGKPFVIYIEPVPGKALKSVVINGKSKKLKYEYKMKTKKNTTVKVVFG